MNEFQADFVVVNRKIREIFYRSAIIFFKDIPQNPENKIVDYLENVEKSLSNTPASLPGDMTGAPVFYKLMKERIQQADITLFEFVNLFKDITFESMLVEEIILIDILLKKNIDTENMIDTFKEVVDILTAGTNRE